jgi:hypothetical protein
MGAHRDDDGDGLADRGRVIDPALYDRQSAAYRDHDGSLHVADGDLERHAERVHAPLGTGGAPIRLPEDYENEQWDADARGPKSIAEARQALADRIDDPAAPDGPEVAGAYDDGDGGRPEDGGAW